MTSKHIRPISIGLIWNDRSLLVGHGFDSIKGEHFFRPLGGAIEFGERAIDALRREFVEELDAELRDEKLITVLENLFQYEAQPSHELVFVYEAKFKDSRFYERPEFAIQELNVSTIASWKSLSELIGGEKPLYPDGLKVLLSVNGMQPTAPPDCQRRS